MCLQLKITIELAYGGVKIAYCVVRSSDFNLIHCIDSFHKYLCFVCSRAVNLCRVTEAYVDTLFTLK